MDKNYYISIKQKYLVMNKLEAVILFYNYFLFRPRIFFAPARKIVKVINFLMILFIKIVYLFKLDRCFKKKMVNENFLLQRVGVGNQPNTIRVHNDGVVTKSYGSEKKFANELRFLEKYSINNSNIIKLPSYSVSNECLCFDFIKSKNLATDIREGKYSNKTIFEIVNKLMSELDIFYGFQERALIHGDFTPDNIYLVNDLFYIIDYSDSEFYYTSYDKYIFIKRILEELYGYCKRDKIERYFSQSEIDELECHFQTKHRIC